MSSSNLVGLGALAIANVVAGMLGWGERALVGTLCVLALLVLANTLVDPYQRFRKPRWYRPYYSRARHLNPGLVRTHAYDIALLGSSMIANMRPAIAGSILGGRCLKLMLIDGSGREIGLLLAAVLRAGKARRVVLALDPFCFRGATNRLGEKAAMPVAYYLPGIVGHLAYLVSFETLTVSIKVVNRSRGKQDRPQFDLERYGFDGDKRDCSREAALGDFSRGAPARVEILSEHALDKLERNARIHLLPLLVANPGVEFDIYFPPYSVLTWVDNARKGVLEATLGFKAFFFDATRTLANVRLFDFQAAEDVVSDLAQYRDVSHYSEKVNERILHWLAAGSGLATPENVRATERALREFSAHVPPC